MMSDIAPDTRDTTPGEKPSALRRSLGLVGSVLGGLLTILGASVGVAAALMALMILPAIALGGLDQHHAARIVVGLAYSATYAAGTAFVALMLTARFARFNRIVWWLLGAGAALQVTSAVAVLVTGDPARWEGPYSFGFYDFSKAPAPLMSLAVVTGAAATIALLAYWYRAKLGWAGSDGTTGTDGAPTLPA